MNLLYLSCAYCTLLDLYNRKSAQKAIPIEPVGPTQQLHDCQQQRRRCQELIYLRREGDREGEGPQAGDPAPMSPARGDP